MRSLQQLNNDWPAKVFVWVLVCTSTSGMRWSAAEELRVAAAEVSDNELDIRAQVDKSEVASSDVLTYAITIAGPLKNPPKVEMNTFQGFQVVATGQSQQIQLSGGRMQQALTLTYTLAPTEVGTHTLGPVKIEYDGQVYETQPIEVKVVQGASKPKKIVPAPQRPRLEGGVIL